MSNERLLQTDMFSGDLVDTRTARQKQLERERERPHQVEMFSQRDLAQFGVTAHPVMDVSPGRLQLISEDPRTEEEKERDRQREAEKLTYPLFPSPVEKTSYPEEGTRPPDYAPRHSVLLLQQESSDRRPVRPDSASSEPVPQAAKQVA